MFKITCIEDKLIFPVVYSKNDTDILQSLTKSCDLMCEGYLSNVDETNKSVLISYIGHFNEDCQSADGLKSVGLILKNINGNEINFESCEFCKFKIPYKYISDLSELHLTYKDQSIKITIVQIQDV